MFNLQKKGDDVWKVLSNAKNEFGNFRMLMDKMERQVGTVQNTLGDIKRKTGTINKALKGVSDSDVDAAPTHLFGFEDLDPPNFCSRSRRRRRISQPPAYSESLRDVSSSWVEAKTTPSDVTQITYSTLTDR